MSKKKKKVKGWPADEDHWRQWLPKNYGEFPSFTPLAGSSVSSGAEMDQRSIILEPRLVYLGAEIDLNICVKLRGFP